MVARRAEKASRKKARLAALEAIREASIQDLKNMAAELGREMSLRSAAISELRTRLDVIQTEISHRRTVTTGGVHVSDHAVLRYLERVRGVNMSEVREEIIAIAKRAGKSDRKPGSASVTDDETGLTLGVSDEDVVTTIYKANDQIVLHTPTISG